MGGGAAGYFGALRAKELCPRLRVTILEAASEPLAKVRGGFRCVSCKCISWTRVRLTAVALSVPGDLNECVSGVPLECLAMYVGNVYYIINHLCREARGGRFSAPHGSSFVGSAARLRCITIPPRPSSCWLAGRVRRIPPPRPPLAPPRAQVRVSGGGRCNVTTGTEPEPGVLSSNYPRGRVELRGAFFRTCVWAGGEGRGGIVLPPIPSGARPVGSPSVGVNGPEPRGHLAGEGIGEGSVAPFLLSPPPSF